MLSILKNGADIYGFEAFGVSYRNENKKRNEIEKMIIEFEK
jgi:hypothetical protein